MTTDMVGNLIRPGDLVVCAAIQGQSGSLRLGVVEDIINDNSIKVNRINKTWRRELRTRRHTESNCSNRILVVRWDSIRPDSPYFDILQGLKNLHMTAR